MKQNILELKKGLSEHELSVFNTEMEKHKKSTGLAYLFWFFLGTLGIHKFYMGKVGSGVLYLALGIGAWISLILGLAADIGKDIEAESFGVGIATGMIFFFILIGIVGLLLLIDLFTISRQIRKAYEKKELKVLEDLKTSE